MKLFRPIKTDRITQWFGENKPCSPDGLLQPVTAPKVDGTCPVGHSKLYPKMGLKGHNGIDMNAVHGEPVYHSADFVGWAHTEVDVGGGIGVRVTSNNSDNGEHFQVLYWHLKSVAVTDQALVFPGNLIGYADSTGLSSGDHVHWGLKKVIVQEFGSKKVTSTLDTGNGYYGAIDPAPYFENKFIRDQIKDPVRENLWQTLRRLLFAFMLTSRR